MPSTSLGVRPASASAASDASVASDSTLRPESRENSVAPIPAMAHRSRWRNALGHQLASSVRSAGRAGPEHLDGVLTQHRGARCSRAAPKREKRKGAPGYFAGGTSSCSTSTKNSRASRCSSQSRSSGELIGPIGRPRRLAVVVGLLRRLQQEEDLDHLLDVAEVAPGGRPDRRTPGRGGRRRCPCVSIQSSSTSHASGRRRRSRSTPTVRRRTGRGPVGWAWAGHGGTSAAARAPSGRTSTGWTARRSLPSSRACRRPPVGHGRSPGAR